MLKLLLVSMPSIHFTRWISNLEDSKFDLYWFDILNKGELKTAKDITQFSNWKKRKRTTLKGEYTLSKKAPSIYQMVEPLFQTTIEEQFTKIIHEVQPDVIHSFQMKDCTYPILKVMQKFTHIPWIYSCWGSDLFFYQNQKKQSRKIKNALKRIDYFHADNKRDYALAKSLGFEGKLFGIIPGGGGYHLSEMSSFLQPLQKRNVILVKGYQHYYGRADIVMEALLKIKEQIAGHKIIVFGAHAPIFKYQHDFENIKIYHRNELNHEDLFKIMGSAKLYIGNSISDGIPNTLLESMIMGAFPIQSNPGGVTSEIIDNGVNGFLIERTDDSSEIKNHILSALKSEELINNAKEKNIIFAKEHLAYASLKDKIEFSYLSIVN